MRYFIPILTTAVTYGITTAENLDKIVKLQKKCVRILTFSDFDSHANPLFIELKILKVPDVIKLQQLKLTYEYNNNLIPQDLRTFFKSSVLKNCLAIPLVKTVHSGIIIEIPMSHSLEPLCDQKYTPSS